MVSVVVVNINVFGCFNGGSAIGPSAVLFSPKDAAAAVDAAAALPLDRTTNAPLPPSVCRRRRSSAGRRDDRRSAAARLSSSTLGDPRSGSSSIPSLPPGGAAASPRPSILVSVTRMDWLCSGFSRGFLVFDWLNDDHPLPSDSTGFSFCFCSAFMDSSDTAIWLDFAWIFCLKRALVERLTLIVLDLLDFNWIQRLDCFNFKRNCLV